MAGGGGQLCFYFFPAVGNLSHSIAHEGPKQVTLGS